MVYRKSTEKLLDWNIRSYGSKPNGYETNNIWKIDPCFDKVHSTVFPAELCKRIIKYYSYKGDSIFDPFAGSGTVGRTANLLNRLFFLTEKESKYFEYMKSKLKSQPLSDEMETRFFNLERFKEEIK
ncbi:MAG: site-specific DNA-methyltransferase [Endomicrobium sp.]|jgi:DNA modification methylase|nr:site-specific DNA-methyltransferase [Endomicrobium sp.]